MHALANATENCFYIVYIGVYIDKMVIYIYKTSVSLPHTELPSNLSHLNLEQIQHHVQKMSQ